MFKKFFQLTLFFFALVLTANAQLPQNILVLKDDTTAATFTLNVTTGAFSYYNQKTDDQYIGTFLQPPHPDMNHDCYFSIGQSFPQSIGYFTVIVTGSSCMETGTVTITDTVYGTNYTLTDTIGIISPTPTPTPDPTPTPTPILTPVPSGQLCFFDVVGNQTWLTVNPNNGNFVFARCAPKDKLINKGKVYSVYVTGTAIIKKKANFTNINISQSDLNGQLQIVGNRATGTFFDRSGNRWSLTVTDTTKNYVCECPQRAQIQKRGVRRHRHQRKC